MTGAKFLDLLMFRLGNRTDPALRAASLLEAVLVQDTELEQGALLPWFLIDATKTAVLTVSNREVALPAGFLKELEEESSLLVTNTDSVEIDLIKKPYDELVNWHGISATSELPENYTLVGLKYLVFPIPTVALAVRHRCYLADVPVNDDTVENLW